MTAIAIAVSMFYFLDFALNALQASLRNLLLDVTPPAQLNHANAWHGRMLHAGSIVGNGVGLCARQHIGIGFTITGFLNLAAWPILRLLGGGQFRKFSAVVVVTVVITVAVTCLLHPETPRGELLRHDRRCVGP